MKSERNPLKATFFADLHTACKIGWLLTDQAPIQLRDPLLNPGTLWSGSATLFHCGCFDSEARKLQTPHAASGV